MKKTRKKKTKNVDVPMEFNAGIKKYEPDFSKLKKMGKAEKMVKVYFCPHCRSFKVGFVFGLRNIFGIIPKMKCSKCGFSGSIFPMAVIDKKKLDELNKKSRSKK